MTEGEIYRLMVWLSPSYPVGSFSYSHGIEWLVEHCAMNSRAALVEWIADILVHGSGRNDAILFSHAYRAVETGDFDALISVAELAAAMPASAERHLETAAQGQAFLDTTCAAWSGPMLAELKRRVDLQPAYPVAVAVAAADHQIPLESALPAYLHAFSANLVSAGVRLIPLGQTDGQIALAELEKTVSEVAQEGLTAGFSDIGGCAFAADMAAMKHETQYTRLFRS